MSDQYERRKSVLTDDDMDRIGAQFEKRLINFCEVIGYDVTTPQSRAEINKDHTFLRWLRKAKNWLFGLIVAAIVSAGVTALANGWIGAPQ